MRTHLQYPIFFGLFLLLAAMLPAQSTPPGYTGSIVDVTRYMAGSQEPDPATTSQLAVAQGLPQGLLTEKGELYLLVPDVFDDTAYQRALELAGTQVTIRGALKRKNGLQALIVYEVKATDQGGDKPAGAGGSGS